MEDRDIFTGGTSTNSSRYNQNERARQSGDNDADRISPTDEKAAEQTNEAYFENGSKEGNSEPSSDKGNLREQQEGSLKNSK